MDFSSDWWNKLEEKEKPWWSVYANLDLCGGELITISDDAQDMLEVKYPNGVMIDVGYVESEYKSEGFIYVITGVKDGTIGAWNDYIIKVHIHNRSILSKTLQYVIYQVQGYIQ